MVKLRVHGKESSIPLSSYKKQFQLMLKKIGNWIRPRFPSIIEEKISCDHYTFLELFFFALVDGIRRIGKLEKEHGSETFFDKFANMLIVFLCLFVPLSITLAYPLISLSDPIDIKIKYIYQFTIILLLSAISWTGFVYLTQDFKKIGKSKIFPIVKKTKLYFYYICLKLFYNGFCLEWQSGRKFRIYFRSYLVLFCVLGAGLSFKFFLIIPINTLILHPSIFEFFQTLVILFPFVVIFFFTFIVLLIILSVILILIFLIVGVLILPIEIKPFIDMGDTKEYGDIVINSLYTLSNILVSLHQCNQAWFLL